MSMEWLDSALEEKFGVRPMIGESGPIIEASHGYMAQIKRVQLEWPIVRDDLPNTVVIKCPVAGSAADAWLEAGGGKEGAAEEKAKAAAEAAENMNKMQAIMHTAESQVYALFDDNYAAPCPMPKTFAAFGMSNDHPAIVMEDITGATITDIVDGWTEKQLYTIIDSIVGIHVMSFTTEKWKSFETDLGDTSDDFVNMTKAFATEILKHNPLPSLEKVRKNLLMNGDWFKAEYEQYKKHPLSVFVHGDMWAPQFLWRGDKLAAIVDWQITHVGSIMEDFLHLLTLGVSPSLRSRLTPSLLQYYYTQLTSKLAEKGNKTPFSFDEMMAEYKSALPSAAVSAIFAFAMWSNSPVLKTGKSDEDARIAEIFSRMASILEECVEAYGW